jgi:alanyl-tRNA synthetase
MLSACQRDASLQRSVQRIDAVLPREDGDLDVILDDTILYAEGGGQPADRGTIAGAPVLDVQKGPDHRVRHRVAPSAALTAGAEVEVVVDWERRWDHMQQHTGQHLLSALLADRWGLRTVGFHLGTESCTIDLDGTLPEDAVAAVEDAANQAILDDRPVTLHTTSRAALEADGLRTRGLPDSVQGPVRLVIIEGLDRNTCGGTHVSRTGALQLLHLTRRDRVRGGTRLGFVVGQRALRRLRRLSGNSAALSELLRAAPEDQLSRVEALLEERKASRKLTRELQQQLAEARAAALAHEPGPVLVHHDPQADLGALRSLATATLPEGDRRVLLGVGAGVFLLRGPVAVVQAAGPSVAALLEGRGGGRGGTYQGRAQRTDAEAVSQATEALSAATEPEADLEDS